jgi:hypothetical protein
MHHRRMVDPAGDAGADALGGAEQDRRSHRRCVEGAAVEHGVEGPQLQWQRVLGAAQQSGVGVRMAIDEARDQPVSFCRNDCFSPRPQGFALRRRPRNRSDVPALDQDRAGRKPAVGKHQRTVDCAAH